MKFNSAYVEVRGLSQGEPFDIGQIRQDGDKMYRHFTCYGKNPWQGILEYGTWDDIPGWYYLGECWPL